MKIKNQLLKVATSDPDDIVKVAGLLKRIKNWFSALTDSDVRAAQLKLYDETQELSQLLPEFYRLTNEVMESIKDLDYLSYRDLLPQLQEMALKISLQVKGVSRSAESIEKTVEQKTVEQQFPSNYNREDYDTGYDKLVEKTKEFYQLHRKNHDVPFGTIEKPLSSFKWFKQFSIDSIRLTPGGKGVLLTRLLKNIPDPDQKSLLISILNTKVAEDIIKSSILNGVLVEYQPVKPSDKVRKFGSALMWVRSAPFQFPNIPYRFYATFVLEDNAAATESTPTLTLAKTVNLQTQKIDLPTDIVFPKKQKAQINEDIDPLGVDYSGEDEFDWGDVDDQALITASSLLSIIKSAAVNPSAYKNFPEEFWLKFKKVAAAINANPLDLAKVLYSESGMDPSAVNMKNGHPVAKGLCQLLLKTALKLGMSKEQWDRLESISPVEQLDWVEKYYRAAGKLKGADAWQNATELYVALAAPAYLSKAHDANAVLYSRELPNGKPNPNYTQNKGLDRDGKGYISPGDLTVSISRPLPKDLIEKLSSDHSSVTIDTPEVKETKEIKSTPDDLLKRLWSDIPIAANNSIASIVKNAIGKTYRVVTSHPYRGSLLKRMGYTLLSTVPQTTCSLEDNQLIISTAKNYLHFKAIDEALNYLAKSIDTEFKLEEIK